MERVMNRTRFAMKKYADRLRKDQKEKRFNEATKKQFSKTHTVLKEKIGKDIRNHEFDMEKSRIRISKSKHEKIDKRKEIKQNEIIEKSGYR